MPSILRSILARGAHILHGGTIHPQKSQKGSNEMNSKAVFATRDRREITSRRLS